VESRLSIAALAGRLSHPIFDPLRGCLERFTGPDCEVSAGGMLETLNALSAERDIRTESGKPLRFVPPDAGSGCYEQRLFESGLAATRSENLHDFFNALVWLSFPMTKARINAMHAERLPYERGQRGSLRDLLTIFDEGGAILTCSDPGLSEALHEHRWKDLLWTRRDRLRAALAVSVIGHAVLEKALEPFPAITCKVIVLPEGSDPDAGAAAWLTRRTASDSPRALAAFPVFGMPGWLPETAEAGFYDDRRWFRPLAATQGKAG
jgi:hypothetical protein